MQGGHHLPAHRVEDGQRGQGPGDLSVLRHAPQLLGGLLDGAVVHQLDAGGRQGGKGGGVGLGLGLGVEVGKS